MCIDCFGIHLAILSPFCKDPGAMLSPTALLSPELRSLPVYNPLHCSSKKQATYLGDISSIRHTYLGDVSSIWNTYMGNISSIQNTYNTCEAETGNWVSICYSFAMEYSFTTSGFLLFRLNQQHRAIIPYRVKD